MSELTVCRETGIARVYDGSSGITHSAHPNIHKSGSVQGMINLGYWAEDDKTVRCGEYIYNISKAVISSDEDDLAARNCNCGERHFY